MTLKFKKSSLVGILVIYYMLMESAFPFRNNSNMVAFFYWTKFIVAIMVIVYAFVKKRNVKELKDMRLISKKLRPYMIFPWIVILIYSVIIWLSQHTATPYITRGLSTIISNVIPVLFGFALVELYGKRILKLIIVAVGLMTITNYIMGCVVNGPSFIIQLFNIFQEESIILKYKELHELAYISGLILIYYFLKKDYKIDKFWILIIGACFFFAWKRIGLLALATALLFYMIVEKMSNKSKKFDIYFGAFLAIIICLVYVALCTSNELTAILDSFGINMMGRNILYNYFGKFCDFSLIYPGRGIGFVSRQFNYITIEDVGFVMYQLKQGLHNDLMCMYIELGMILFIIWLFYQLLYIPRKINRYFGTRTALFCFSLIIFNFVTYTTDNTLRYFVFQTVYIVLVSILCYDGKTQKDMVLKDIPL